MVYHAIESIMVTRQTAPSLRLTELYKARARVPLIAFLAILIPPLVGVRGPLLWIAYLLFAVLYAIWALRLTAIYPQDSRLGLLLCLTDTAIVFPLIVWSGTVALRVGLLLLCAGGWAFSLVIRGVNSKRRLETERRSARAGRGLSGGEYLGRTSSVDSELLPQQSVSPLERAVRERLGLFATTGARFALVVLRVLRWQEAATYYGPTAAERMLHAVARRGLRQLGPDAQHFYLSEGRVAFLFATGPFAPAGQGAGGSAGRAVDEAVPVCSDPYDIEGIAMSVARKACEHLVDGHRVECVVGWASAPADGISVEDLLYVAETGAQSTEAFRRVAGPPRVRERARAAAG